MSSETGRRHFKAVLLGDSGVGKTSLVTRWTTGLYQKSTSPTVGANHQLKRVTLHDQEVDIYLWDTAGQEQFQALTPLYARAASVAVLVCSITDEASFANVDHWVELLSSAIAEIPPIIMAVNKMDLIEEAKMTTDKITETFQERFAGLFFVSAVTNEEVDNMFMSAAEAGFNFMNSHANTDKKIGLTADEVSRSGCQC